MLGFSCRSKMKLILSVILAFIASRALVADSTDGVDVSTAVMPNSWSCMKKNGRTFAIIRCYQSNGRPDANCPHTIYNAWDGGMEYVDVYFFPDFHKGNPAGQVREMGAFRMKIATASIAPRLWPSPSLLFQVIVIPFVGMFFFLTSRSVVPEAVQYHESEPIRPAAHVRDALVRH